MPASHLIIRLSSAGTAEWLARGRDGRILAGPQAGLPAETAERIDVLVPAEDVLLLRAPRVARQRRQLELALPFAVEEQLAAPVETLHVAAGAEEAGDEITVAVVAQARLDAWLATLRGAGLEPDRLLPESWLVPAGALLVDGDRAVLRYADAGAFAGHVGEVAGWVDLLRADGRWPANTHTYSAAAGGSAQSDANAATSLPAIGERESIGSALRWFSERLAQAPALNLLQGRHAPRRGREGARTLWRRAAAVAAFALVAAIAQVALEQSQLRARREAQRAEMEQLLRSALPGVQRVVDPKAQLASAHARLGQGPGQGALPLLARIAPLIAGSGLYTLDAIEFRAETLEITLRTRDVAALDSLRESLATLPGLQVEVTGANPGSGGIEGRLRIRSRA